MDAARLAGTFVLIFSGLANAGQLCDAQCRLAIDFPGGGSIEAVEALVITFGDAGLVDTAGSVTAYVAAETLALEAGEALLFGDGGHFDIGNAGNIEYTFLRIVTDGEIWLQAIGASETVTVAEGSTLALQGTAASLESNIELSGKLTIGAVSLEPASSTMLVVSGSIGTASMPCMLGDTLVLDPDHSLSPGDRAACETVTPGSIDTQSGSLVLDTGGNGQGVISATELILATQEAGAQTDNGEASDSGGSSAALLHPGILFLLLGLCLAGRAGKE